MARDNSCPLMFSSPFIFAKLALLISSGSSLSVDGLFCSWSGFVDVEHTAVELGAVEASDGIVGVGVAHVEVGTSYPAARIGFEGD